MNSNLDLRNACPACTSSNRLLKYSSTIKNAKATYLDYVGTNTGYGLYHDLYICSDCQVLYMDPIDSNLDELCADVIDNDYLASWEERSFNFKDHINELVTFISKGQLLDIGCYAGIFLEEAKNVGFQVTGIEPSKWAADYARTRVGCAVHQGIFEKYDLINSKFDVITIWDVIEHLSDPRLSLKKTFELLNPGGIVAISTHDIDSIFAKILGKRYPWLMRFHLVHFSPKSLSRLLTSLGFNIESILFYKKPLSIKYFLQRIGLNVKTNAFTRKRIAFNTHDMFMIIAKKPLNSKM